MSKLLMPIGKTFPLPFSFLFTLLFSFISFSDVAAQGGYLRTQTQEQWGAVPKGNNTAAYMYHKFNAAFPNGLTIGCTGKMTFLSPDAITNFLPSNDTAVILPSGTKVNPESGFSNILAGHIVALKLNIVFDEHDPLFSSNNSLLKNSIIKAGIFAGKTVQQVLEEAENTIGGCANQYQLSDLHEIIAQINQNYNNTTSDMGLLKSSNVTSNTCINDTEPPVFREMPQTFTVFVDECYIAAWNVPVVTDNCSTVTLTSSINLGECLPIGVHKVKMIAKDESGNKSTYNFTVTIEQGVYIAPLNSDKRNTELVVHPTKNTVNIDWVNKNNEQVSHFIIQKADAQGNYTDIKIVNANPLGGSQTYYVSDDLPENADNSYRIKTILKDNSMHYSLSKTTNYKDKDFVQIYPSPSADMVNIDLSSYSNQNIRLSLYDYLGQLVYRQFIKQVSDKPVPIDILDLPDGQYLLSIIPEKSEETTKVLFIKN